jgi:MoaA/NifB/PqqE/SkfB family radical SAM enzyme
MCSYWKKNQKGDLNTKEVQDVLLGLSKLKCQKIHFTGGEIFMRKDALTLMQYAHDLGMRVTLTTNGTLLKKETIKTLLKIPARSITLSLDGPHPKLHDTIRGQKNAFKKTMKTLEYLLRYKKPKNKIRINTVVHQQNYTQLPEMAHLLSAKGINSWLLIPMDAWVEKENMPNKDDINRYNTIIAPLLEDIVDIPEFSPWIYGRSKGDLEHSIQQHYARDYYKTKPCFIPWFHILVGPKGDVYPCCGTHRLITPLGNVRDNDIYDIFNGESLTVS